MSRVSRLLDVVVSNDRVTETVRMIDCTVIRAHHSPPARGGGLRDRVSGAREMGLRPEFISAPTACASR
jgi:hypothetical protein